MMYRVSDIIDRWLGLCRKSPAFCTSQSDSDNLTEPSQESFPDRGRGGLRRIQRGLGAARSATKTLIHNPQLLWFTLLAGLVIAGHFLAQGALMVASRNNGGTALIASPVIAFLVEFPTVFCLVFLLAGLILSLSSKKDGPASFVHGLRMAVQHLKPLAGWSLVIALAGTILFTAILNMDRSFNILGALWMFLLTVLHQFPFSWCLNPDVYIQYGTFSQFLGEFRIGFGYFVILSIITILLFAVTLFVVPQLVLERKPLKKAISGSVTLMKNIRGEVAASLLGLGIIVSIALLTFFLFQFTGIDQVAGMHIRSTRPSDAWIAFGLLYILALTGFVFVVATVGGIVTLELYKEAKVRESVP